MSSMTTGVSPHIRSGRTTQSVMLDVIIALCPALIASVVIYGFRALLLTCVSVIVCVLLEFVWEKLMKLPVTVSDLSAVVTGMLLAFNVPVGLPVWELIVGDIAAIILVKMLFGGLGCNFMNPALVGRIVIMFSFTTDMTTYAVPKLANAITSGGVDAVSTATPLTMMDQLGWADFPKLLLGAHGGVLGEVCAAALILGGIYLIVRKSSSPSSRCAISAPCCCSAGSSAERSRCSASSPAACCWAPSSWRRITSRAPSPTGARSSSARAAASLPRPSGSSATMPRA